MPEQKLLKNNTMEMWFLIINCGCSNLYDSIKPSSPEFLSLHRQQLSFPVHFYRWFIQVISVSTKFNHAFSKKCNFSTNTVEFFYTVEFQMQRSRLLKSAVSHTSMLFADRDFLYGPSKAGKTCIHLFIFWFCFSYSQNLLTNFYCTLYHAKRLRP